MRLALDSFPEISIFDNSIFSDERGKLTKFELPSVKSKFDSVLISKNTLAGTVRGLHFQANPHGEVKLVTCINGKVIDYVLDVRENSPNFGNWAQFELDDAKQQSILIPSGFAHGFQSLVPHTDILYMISGGFSPDHSITLNVNDPDIALEFPLAISSISDNDLRGSSLREFCKVQIGKK